MNGADCLTNDELTPQAQNWLNEISTLTAQQLREGMQNLSRLDTKGFAPNVIQFVQHCREIERDECIDEIWQFIQRSPESDLWWKTDMAYTVFTRLQYNPALNENHGHIQDRLIKIFDSIGSDDILEAPPKPMAIQQKPMSKQDHLHQAFQGKMYGCIKIERPDLIVQPLDPDGRTLNGLQVPDEVKSTWGRQDRATVDLFTPHKTRELMSKWAASIGDITDIESYIPNMKRFLLSEGLI